MSIGKIVGSIGLSDQFMLIQDRWNLLIKLSATYDQKTTSKEFKKQTVYCLFNNVYFVFSFNIKADVDSQLLTVTGHKEIIIFICVFTFKQEHGLKSKGHN